MRILVIDSDEWVLRAMARALRESEVIATGDGDEALRHALSGERFDVILCDASFRGKDGQSLCDELLSCAAVSPDRMVVTTVHPLQTIEGLRRLPKAFTVGELRAVVAEAALNEPVSGVHCTTRQEQRAARLRMG